jgi:hypothetical protein
LTFRPAKLRRARTRIFSREGSISDLGVARAGVITSRGVERRGRSKRHHRLSLTIETASSSVVVTARMSSDR